MRVEKRFGPVWVIAEEADGRVLSVSLQLVGRARKLADELGTPLEVILLGESLDAGARTLIEAGADRVYVADDPLLATYHADYYSEIIVRLAEGAQPEIILMGSTPVGRELPALVAARLKTGLTAHCIDLAHNEALVMEQHVPAYGGLITIICPERRPQMATVARGVFPDPDLDARRMGEVVPLVVPRELPDRIETLEVVFEEQEGVPLESAAVVVAGGAGASNLEGWGLIEQLARTLKAGLGSTRPAVDEGWTDLETMIGQSGKMVSPDLYIGVALSGELQHMVGVVGAKVMVAINNDPKAPVFEQVDYGIVDDCREFIPVLIEKIREYRSE
jgi:electron transfer flavoprotein alpha subunit